MRKVRAIQVGIGGIGSSHLRALLANEKFGVAAVCDAYPRRPDVKAGLEKAKQSGIPVFTDYRQAFQEVDAEAAFICTPHHWHAPMTIAALRRGMHVFVEKPAAPSVVDIRAMLSAQKKSRKAVLVGFGPTASAECIGLKDHIAQGDLGEIREVVVVLNWYREDSYYRRSSWVGKKKVDGKWCRDGVLYNQTSHSIAAALLLANTRPWPDMSVASRARAELYRGHPVRRLEMEDLACAVLDLDAGSTRFYLYASTCNTTQNDVTWVKVFGDKGQATLGTGRIELYNGRSLAVKAPKVVSKHDNLYAAITRGAPPYSPLAESAKVTETIDLIYRSTRTAAALLRSRRGDVIRPVKWEQLGQLAEMMSRSAAQRCLFSEVTDPHPWTR
jgi:predicted dehydrogenase